MPPQFLRPSTDLLSRQRTFTTLHYMRNLRRQRQLLRIQLSRITDTSDSSINFSFEICMTPNNRVGQSLTIGSKTIVISY